MSAPEPTYSMDQPQLLPTHVARHVSHTPSSHYQSPQMHLSYLPQQQAQQSRKRSHPEDISLDYQGLQMLEAQAAHAGADIPVELTPHGHHAQPQAGSLAYHLQSQQRIHHTPTQQHVQLQQQQQQHHHHRLPNQPPPVKQARHIYGEPSSSAHDTGPPSVVGQEGMPAPAPRPKGPKLKFTPEDDALLVELKETKNLTWKQIADFFPGRSSGTLQVRYCTKLKAKTTVWTDEMVSPSLSPCPAGSLRTPHLPLLVLESTLSKGSCERFPKSSPFTLCTCSCFLLSLLPLLLRLSIVHPTLESQ